MKTVIPLSSDKDNDVDGALSNIEDLLTDEMIDIEAVALIVNSTRGQASDVELTVRRQAETMPRPWCRHQGVLELPRGQPHG